MTSSNESGAVAIVGVGCILPDAPNVSQFWSNLTEGRYSISETPTDRWDPVLYYDPDPKAPDKLYSKIGGWVKEFEWKPFEWKMPIPPKVADVMDRTHKWALGAAQQALVDYGYPDRTLDRERTAVIVGNAMGGDRHYLTALRIYAPEYVRQLEASPHFASLDEQTRAGIAKEMLLGIQSVLPNITEDTMPGELANIIAGRIAAVYDLHGPNFVADAACASAMAAMSAAMEGLDERHFDVALTGGVDANMSVSAFVKFCKIGALSATGTRPYDEGADGFVMGEGAAMFVLKRLEDAERDRDTIHAVLRGIGGASDGKGKGITAPNPVGQRLAVARGWQIAGERPDADTYIEGHGTSTRVGDVVEVESMSEVLREYGVAPGTIPLGSVKSNIGHLKGAAGAAGILKATLALKHRTLPPSINVRTPNPKIDFAQAPVFVNTELRSWNRRTDGVRRAGVSAFGFGGTNFHAVLEEHEPGRLTRTRKTSVAVAASVPRSEPKAPLRGVRVVQARSLQAVGDALGRAIEEVQAGTVPPPRAPILDPAASVRIAIDYADGAELEKKLKLTAKAAASGNSAAFKALRAQGVHVGTGAAPKVAFLYPGQGSQYVNMLAELRRSEPVVEATIREADQVMTPILGRPLSEIIYADPNDEAAMARANHELRQTAVTQPAVLTVDIALTRLLAEYGIEPDMVMGHSLGEYGALVAAGGMSFAHALEAVAARGAEMTKVSVGDNGKMAAVMGPLDVVQKLVDAVDGYVVVANINSHSQAVIGGASDAVEKAVVMCQEQGLQAQLIPVSHAFHTSIVEPASGPMMDVLRRLDLSAVKVPLVGNVNGGFYPVGPDAPAQMVELLGRQIASPVQFIRGLETLYEAGARVFVEVGPKKALHGFTENVLGDREGVLALFTNHPKVGDLASFNQALTGLYALGVAGAPAASPVPEIGVAKDLEVPQMQSQTITSDAASSSANGRAQASPILASWGNGHSQPPHPGQPLAAGQALAAVPSVAGGGLAEVGRLFARFMEDSFRIMGQGGNLQATTPVVVSGASVGLPGGESVFGDDAVARLLDGEPFIDAIPMSTRKQMVSRHITRVVKGADGSGSFQVIDSAADTIKLAGQAGRIGLVEDFGYPADRAEALDATTELAIAAGIEALRDAGIPLVMHYKTTTRGTFLPERWMLPESLQDDTGVIFGSAFPGAERFAKEADAFRVHQELSARKAELEHLQQRFGATLGEGARAEIARRIEDLELELKTHFYQLDRRFVFRILAMGHSQFAEYVGARGPNTHVNAACASGTQCIGIAQDWIRTGRCRRVIVMSADNVTSEALMPWVGSGFLATGAAATDELVEDAALPFDRRRHGLILGMGAAAVVLEAEDAVRERGLSPITEVMASRFANSAFHGTRLDPAHITREMEALVAEAEQRYGISRSEMARQMVFISHETYTPARGGSAQTEVLALRKVFGDDADRIVVANTKGQTGHAMGTGIEDVLGIKALETGVVPAVPNFREVDSELGTLNLSKGGSYPVQYALRFGAGFGSQLALSLMRRVPSGDGRRPLPRALGFETRIEDRHRFEAWLSQASGHADAELEVVHRTLRVKDAGPSDAVVRGALEAPAPAAAVESGLSVHPEAMATEAPDPARAPSPAAAPAPSAPAVEARAPAPAVPSAPAVEAPAAPAVGPSSVQARILEIVAHQTGYPSDMLDPELDLEADLGIDTVKQAEMFAAVRESFDIERDPNLQLRDFNTLEKVVGFVLDRRPDLASAGTPAADGRPASTPVPAEGAPQATGAPGPDPVRDRILEIVAQQTGYPSDMLDPELDLEADLGIDTVKQAEMFAAVRETFGIERDPNLQLRDFNTLEKVVGFVLDRRPDLIAAPAAAEAPAAAPPQPAVGSEDPILAKVLELVAEQTGYPADMLDPELDLEADLGIDTVKQAEMFAAVRETFGIERDPNLQLRDFNTLRKVAGFVHDRSPGRGPDPTDPTGGGAPARESPASTASCASMEAAGAIPRRVPVAVLRSGLERMAETGVRLASGDRVVLMPDAGGVGDALQDVLQERGVTVLRLDPPLDGPDFEAQVQQFADSGPVVGVYWLPALDPEAEFESLDLSTFQQAVRVRCKLMHRTLRRLYGSIDGSSTFLVSATRMGGRFGFELQGAMAPLGGAVAGFTKAFAREKPDATVKVVDFQSAADAASVAEALVGETLRDRGVVEVGRASGRRIAIGLQEVPVDDGAPGLELGPDSVVVVTGAAGSITSAIVADLAGAAKGATFHLLDKAGAPSEDDPDLVAFSHDREGLKRALFDRIKASGEKATPAKVERHLAELERKAAALEAIRAVRAAGGEAHYGCLDLRDHEGVVEAVREAGARRGRIDLIVHAGGLEISRFLPDKSADEFDLVFDVKAQGWLSVMSAAREFGPTATVVFSSIAGRFGNAGQTDYAAANDLLAKTSSALRARGVRALVMDWTAWGGIGMATRGSIPKMMEAAGIDMLPPEAGIPFVRRELTAGGRADEVVVAQRLGVLEAERDPDGSLEPGAWKPDAVAGPMADRAVGEWVQDGLVFETELDPTAQPFLDHHRIDGTSVLPGVMGLEAFAEVAKRAHPELHVRALEEVRFLAPFKFYRDEPRLVRIEARFVEDGADVLAQCRLVGRRVLAGQAEAQTTLHFSGTVRLGREPEGPESVPGVLAEGEPQLSASDIYGVYFHGPAYQVLDGAWNRDGMALGRYRAGLPGHHQPAHLPLQVAPRWVELCFQTAGVEQIGRSRRLGLPASFERLRLFDLSESQGVIARARRQGPADGPVDVEVVTDDGRLCMRLEGYRTAMLPGTLDGQQVEPFARLFGE